MSHSRVEPGQGRAQGVSGGGGPLPGHHTQRPQTERHGPGAERPGHPSLGGLRLEGKLPRERRGLAPACDAMGRDEMCHMLLQSNDQNYEKWPTYKIPVASCAWNRSHKYWR